MRRNLVWSERARSLSMILAGLLTLAACSSGKHEEEVQLTPVPLPVSPVNGVCGVPYVTDQSISATDPNLSLHHTGYHTGQTWAAASTVSAQGPMTYIQKLKNIPLGLNQVTVSLRLWTNVPADAKPLIRFQVYDSATETYYQTATIHRGDFQHLGRNQDFTITFHNPGSCNLDIRLVWLPPVDSAYPGAYTTIEHVETRLHGLDTPDRQYDSTFITRMEDGFIERATTGFTFMAWVKTVNASGVILGYQNSLFVNVGTVPTKKAPALYIDKTGKLRGGLWLANQTFSAMNSNRPITDGSWHHVALVGTSGEQKLYLDGVLVDSRAGAVSAAGLGFNQIGVGYTVGASDSYGTWEFFQGSMGNIAYLRRAMTTTEINTIFTQGKKP